MQDEQLLPYLTVQESMEAAVVLKLGNSTSEPSKKDLIDEILTNVGIAKCKHTRVSDLSGGEKKRLSIAFEVISKPSVMFLDEPTSGLDSHNSYLSIVLLKKLAKEGRTIICTIHQPSTKLFEQFDYVYALAEGNCVYRGTVPGLRPFMSSISLQCPSYYNAAELLIEASSGECGNYITTLVDAVKVDAVKIDAINGSLSHEGDRTKPTGTPIQLDLVSDSKIHEDKPLNQGDIIYASNDETNIDLSSCSDGFLSQKVDGFFQQKTVPFWTQFCVLLIRTFRSIYRDQMLTLFRLAIHVFTGLFVGMLYYDIGNEASDVLSNLGYLYFSILFYIITAVTPTVITFPLEAKVLVREHRNNWYSLKAYYLAKTLADTPFQIMFSFFFISIIYFMTSQPSEIVRFLLIAIIGILNSLVSQSIGLIIGAAWDIQYAVYATPVSVVPPILISGIFIKLAALPSYLRWMTYFSYIRYCYEGSIKVTYGYNRNPLHCSEGFCIFKYPKKIMEQFGIEDNGLWLDILILFIISVLVRVLGYFVLRRTVRRKLE